MSTPALLHIGYHKTGSTWFQKQLYPYTQSHRYIPRRPVQEALLMERAFDFDPDRARDILAVASDHKPLIICEEELSGNRY